MKRQLTCIVCPMGCTMEIELEDKNVISVSGNTCPRGEKYAREECTNPMRTITSTVKCEDGTLLSVKTDRTIPKDKMFECMKIINSVITPLPVSVGDVIIKDVFGANVVATQAKEA